MWFCLNVVRLRRRLTAALFNQMTPLHFQGSQFFKFFSQSVFGKRVLLEAVKNLTANQKADVQASSGESRYAFLINAAAKKS